MEAPSGTVTFLFTDIEGSTRLWESAPEIMRSSLARHDAIVRGAIEGHAGYVFATGGDGFAAAFSRPVDAVAAAVDATALLAGEAWPDASPIRVRMGIHTGVAEIRGGDYFGPTLNRTARLMAVAHGGQVVCSAATSELIDTVDMADLGEQRLRDLDRPIRVFQVGDGRFPPLRSLDVSRTNLPVVLTELIGRANEMAEVTGLLRDRRLVTLTGTGGVGKTRLALAVAAEASPGFPDGCWLVELAPVTTPDDVARAVASALGAPASDGLALARYLGERRALVVLDNCEHVVDAAAGLVEAVLAAGREPVVIATSREPLGVAGEEVRRVRSLRLPDAGAGVVDAEAADAVRLFVERAAAGGGFALDADNVGPVVEVCRRLDGIPLAIELAAALARAMPPAAIATRLDERFRLLSGGPRRAQERHRTLQAAVAWSHDLLPEAEKVVFRRLAVFPASFDLPAAEAVAAGNGVEPLVGLVHLVDRSLVQYDPGEGRYQLLETLRHYGAERLAEAGESAATRARHTRYFVSLAARLGPETEDRRYEAALPLLQQELDNLRATADWLADRGAWAELAAMVLSVRRFVFAIVPAEAVAWYRQVVDHEDDIEPGVVSDVLAELAWLSAVGLAERASGVGYARRSLDIAHGQQRVASPWAHLTLAESALWGGDFAPMLPLTNDALAAAKARGDGVAETCALGYLAMCYAGLGEHDRAASVHQASVEAAERNGHRDAISSAAVTGASRYLWTSATPDFAASLAALERHDLGPRFEDATAVYLDVMWGASLVGLHRPGGVAHLARATQLADRLSVVNALELALRFLAIAAAQAGHQAEAAMLNGYADAKVSVYNRDAGALGWHLHLLEDALAGLGDRREQHATGAELTRTQLQALVRELDRAPLGDLRGARSR